MDTKEVKIFFSVIIPITLIGLIFFYLVVLIIRQNRKNSALQKAISLAEINALENERTRIASDLHDDLGPILTVIKFQLENAISNSKDCIAGLLAANRQLDEVVTKLREISYNLLPTALQNNQPFIAIEEFIYLIRESSSLKIMINYPPLLLINKNHGLQIFRIVQEAVNNVFKHSQATAMSILFSEHNNKLRLICIDDGIGFSMNHKTKLYAGRGLCNIRNRTHIMGGRFNVNSEKGKGTVLTIEIPLE